MVDVGDIKLINSLTDSSIHCCWSITGACCQELSITLSIHPSHKVVSNSTVVLRCTVDRNILGHGDVEWYRRQGVNKYQLGRGSVRQWQLTNSTRYQLRTESQTASKAVYRLTITGMCQSNIFTWAYLTLPYHMGKMFYRLALRPLTGPMHIPELTIRLQNPQNHLDSYQHLEPSPPKREQHEPTL